MCDVTTPPLPQKRIAHVTSMDKKNGSSHTFTIQMGRLERIGTQYSYSEQEHM